MDIQFTSFKEAEAFAEDNDLGNDFENVVDQVKEDLSTPGNWVNEGPEFEAECVKQFNELLKTL